MRCKLYFCTADVFFYLRRPTIESKISRKNGMMVMAMAMIDDEEERNLRVAELQEELLTTRNLPVLSQRPKTVSGSFSRILTIIHDTIFTSLSYLTLSRFKSPKAQFASYGVAPHAVLSTHRNISIIPRTTSRLQHIWLC